jgi:GNAT superfamily N-acetyltransferase
MLAASLAAADGEAGFWLTDDDDGPVGMAYCEPERMTAGTWNLQLIMIQGDRQGQGRGTQLLRAIEQAVMDRQGRMLIVETSGLPEFAGPRAFYAQAGYEAEGGIRDFYAAGDDKVIFRKVLTPVA